MSRQFFYQTVNEPQEISLKEAIDIILRVEYKLDIIRRDLQQNDLSRRKRWVRADILHELTVFDSKRNWQRHANTNILSGSKWLEFWITARRKSRATKWTIAGR